MDIDPAWLTFYLSDFSSSQSFQLSLTIENLDINEIITSDSVTINVNSIYDLDLYSSTENRYKYETMEEWLTPEWQCIEDWIRLSNDCLDEFSWDGENLYSMKGYQEQDNLSKSQVTYGQIYALMHTLADDYGVEYVSATFSASSDEEHYQRIKYPSDVLSSKSGNCIELSLALATALQALDMNNAIVLSPGHAQLAVETWEDSGNYFLVESTALTAAKNFDHTAINSIYIVYLDHEEWETFLSEEGTTAILMDLTD